MDARRLDPYHDGTPSRSRHMGLLRYGPMTIRLMAVLLALAGVACGSSPNGATSVVTDCQVASVAHIDDCVRMNQLQVLGTHNSYHLAAAPALLAALGEHGRNLDYTHRPLTEQLARGIRQFELDVFADPEGGHYSAPAGLPACGSRAASRRRPRACACPG